MRLTDKLSYERQCDWRMLSGILAASGYATDGQAQLLATGLVRQCKDRLRAL